MIGSKEKIIDISLAKGFESPESFDRSFKKQYKLSPTEYRTNGKELLIGNKPVFMGTAQQWMIPKPPEIIIVPPIDLIGMNFEHQLIQ